MYTVMQCSENKDLEIRNRFTNSVHETCSEQMIAVQLNTTISTIIQVMRIVIISNAVWWLLVC